MIITYLCTCNLLNSEQDTHRPCHQPVHLSWSFAESRSSKWYLQWVVLWAKWLKWEKSDDHSPAYGSILHILYLALWKLAGRAAGNTKTSQTVLTGSYTFLECYTGEQVVVNKRPESVEYDTPLVWNYKWFYVDYIIWINATSTISLVATSAQIGHQSTKSLQSEHPAPMSSINSRK